MSMGMIVGQQLDPKNKFDICGLPHDLTKPGVYTAEDIATELGLTVGTAPGEVTLCSVELASKDCKDSIEVASSIGGGKGVINLQYGGQTGCVNLKPGSVVQLDATALDPGECVRTFLTWYVNPS